MASIFDKDHHDVLALARSDSESGLARDYKGEEHKLLHYKICAAYDEFVCTCGFIASSSSSFGKDASSLFGQHINTYNDPNWRSKYNAEMRVAMIPPANIPNIPNG